MKRIIFVGLCLTQVVYLLLRYMTFGSLNVMAVADRLVGAATALLAANVLTFRNGVITHGLSLFVR